MLAKQKMTSSHEILYSNIIATFAKEKEKIVNGEASAYNITESIRFPIYDEILHSKRESEVLNGSKRHDREIAGRL